MERFAALYCTLDATTSTRRKVQAMAQYLQEAPAADAAWAVYFLAGGRPGRLIATRQLRDSACAISGLPEWLFEESYQAVGDLAETIAHVLPDSGQVSSLGLAQWMTDQILPMRGQPAGVQHEALARWWQQTSGSARFVLNKLLTGAMRVGVSRLLVVRALAEAFDLDRRDVSQRIMGYTDKHHEPDAAAFDALTAPPGSDAMRVMPGRPYPFFLAHPLTDGDAVMSTDVAQWQIEWKWDGIRAQLIRRDDRTWLWSRGEELITDRFPDLHDMAKSLPDGTVLDGELLCWHTGQTQPLPFSVLQTRIGRKNLTRRLLNEAPAVLVAYDVLEVQGRDIRECAQRERREQLEAIVNQSRHPALHLSPRVYAPTWAELDALRTTAREQGVEGLMLKSIDTRYGVGRTRQPDGSGCWLKWKLDPLTIDCVLIYAQRGHGRRASLYSDYTFAVWDQPPGNPARQLVPFAKAYSGLTDEQIKWVDSLIRKTTREKFGPVRSVDPSLVVELGFESIQASRRHKSGVAVRFPRMLRIRQDKTIEQANTLQDLTAWLPPQGAS